MSWGGGGLGTPGVTLPPCPGHPRPDDVPGAAGDHELRAVQALPQVSPPHPQDPVGGTLGAGTHGGVGVGWEQPPRPHAGSPPCQFLPSSEDYGKTFKDITSLINNTFIRTEFGMAIGPENSGKVGGGGVPGCQ